MTLSVVTKVADASLEANGPHSTRGTRALKRVTSSSVTAVVAEHEHGADRY